MRRLPRFALLAFSAILVASCTDATTGTGTSQLGGRIGLAPAFTPAAARALSALSAFGLEVTTVHIQLVAPDGSTRDTVVDFPAGTDTLSVELGVPARTAGQTFRADLQLLSADGQILFSGSQQVVAHSSNTLPGAERPPSIVQINYTGPGSDAKTVTVSPATGSITGTGSLGLSATGRDASGAPLGLVLVRWTTSDGSLATVTANGNNSATVTSLGKRGTVTVSAITPLGVTGTAQITLVPAAAKLVVISGGGQTGPAGEALPQPFVVEVQATDNLPVSGATVTFRSVTAGGVAGTTTVVTDASGRASTTMTLGSTAGAYVFEAASPSLGATTISATATPAPAAGIAIVSGNFQSSDAGTALAQPLVVKVTNKFGAPVAGVTVKWETTVGRGAPASATSTTAADGTASMAYTLGSTALTETVRASLASVPGPSGEVFFNVGARAGPPDAIDGTGGGQHAFAGSPLPNPLVVTVTDAFGNPVQGVSVTWAASSSTGSTATFSPASSTTNAQGRAQTTVTLGGSPGPLIIVATAGPLNFKFAATVDGTVVVGSPGVLSGQVYNAVTGAPLGGASVNVVGGSINTTLTTASDGRYSTGTTVPAGNYDIAVSATGFVGVTIVGQHVDGNTVAEAVPMVPANSTPGSISGTVLDATNNQAVAAAVTVELRAGMNNTTGTILQTFTTGTNGQYLFSNVAAGTYTVVARASGYSAAFKTGISVGATNTANQNVFISPAGAAGLVRIVLTWRSTPRDLDSHLTGPTSQGPRFHVWYAGSGNCSSAPFACLDNDVTSGSGPETITITQVLPGIYRYSVQNYSAAGNGSNPTDLTLSNSGGRVDVYIGNTLAQTFAVPAGAGSLWTVFELNGTTITPVNSISAGPVLLPSLIPLAGSGGSSIRRTDATVIFNDIAAHPKPGAGPR